MRFRHVFFTAITIIGICIAVTDSQAQFGGFGSRSRGGDQGQGGKQNYQNNHQPPDPDSYEQTEYRLALLEDDLHLQAAQRTPWNTFADKMSAYASDLARARARSTTIPATGNSFNGVQVIEQAADAARNRATALDEVAIAAKALYATLSTDQKMLADIRISAMINPPGRLTKPQTDNSSLPNLGSPSGPPQQRQ